MPSDTATLWDFALDLYQAKHVSDACIALQDESCVDVLVLLFALWLADNSVALTAADVEQADSSVAEWREQVSRPLRGVRRFLKQDLVRFGGAAEGFRQQVKGVELESELIALSVLETRGIQLIGSREGALKNTAQANADAVVRFYRRTEFDTACRAALDTILEVFTRRSTDGPPW